MFPKTLALIDDDKEYTEFLSQYLRQRGMEVVVFEDSNDLLASQDPYSFDFYLIDLMLPGIDGVALIKLLRRRSQAGVLVISGRVAPDVFKQIVDAGADMYLGKPVQFEQVALAIQAVQRRAGAGAPANAPWQLDRRARQLLAPDGARVDLSDIDLLVMECLVEAQGEPVTREALCRRLGRDKDGEADDGLNATMYRLRRRIVCVRPSHLDSWRCGGKDGVHVT